MADYDYVIVGGGSAGCVLANRLSEDPGRRVLLLEAGGSGTSPFIQMPAANGFLFGRPAFDWGYSSVPQPGLGGRRMYYPRGRGLGGSSSINGMVYIRGNAQDYDGWRQLGLDGWAYADVLPYFKRAEDSARGDNEFHGGGGPLRTRPSANYNAIDRRFMDAAGQAGLALNPDFNGASQIGRGVYDVTVRGGRRCSAEQAYLAPARRRPNLTVITGAHATRLLMEDGRARGIAYERGGRPCEAEAGREVILALGAFATPQLMMLSGLGPAHELRRHGIAVAVDLPGVGDNLQDHVNMAVQVACTDPTLTFARYQRLDHALWLGLRYLFGRRGPGAAPFWSAGAFIALDDGSELPDLQIFFTPMVLIEDPNDEFNQPVSRPLFDLRALGRSLFVRGQRAISGYQVDSNLMRPESRGRLSLRSADPFDHPAIDPQFLSAESDCRIMVKAVKRARRLLAQPAFDGVRGPELAPGPEVQSDDDILDAVRRAASCAHHPVGTCKMGIAGDPLAVVDSSLRVRGIDGLRVVDASVLPRQITGNTNGPIIMIAEKAADMIRGRPALSREHP